MKPRLKPGLPFVLLAAALAIVPWILRRAERRGKKLPAHLAAALRAVR